MNDNATKDAIDPRAEDEAFFIELRREIASARAKFPQQSFWRTLAALTEEVGELNQAILQHRPYASIRAEAVQVATMALRVANDCDLEDDEGETA